MVSAEGQFPKVGNDDVYASEINRINPKLIVYNNTYINEVGVNFSGTNFTCIGSYLYTGYGSMQISEYMTIQTGIGVAVIGTVTSNISVQVLISGTDGLNNMVVFNRDATNSTIVVNHVLTSGAITASGGNVSSPYWLFHNIKTDIPSAPSRNVFVDGILIVGH